MDTNPPAESLHACYCDAKYDAGSSEGAVKYGWYLDVRADVQDKLVQGTTCQAPRQQHRGTAVQEMQQHNAATRAIKKIRFSFQCLSIHNSYSLFTLDANHINITTMPSDEYASVSGGALRLKGAKVEKHKKKHKKDKKDRKDRKDKNTLRAERAGEQAEAESKDKGQEHDTIEAASDNDDDPYARMTPAERRFAEAQDQKIRTLMHATPEEAKAARPDLFKSHKERLADLNTYLSRMSEHNDMPKIGPG
ncbi:hypothetical protein F503_07240 [Ophiostoma piceae UAMH 11346]|uniref:DUF1754-domain-containing protein n=1 Tax=Ophiostoma piceae (strain UAMH 11346) TaxID=1262450 RepID=S3C7D6_OPHP1|nr:hypothetical protein F503_07240 [Ophiostoma piceae UAMH 11346]